MFTLFHWETLIFPSRSAVSTARVPLDCSEPLLTSGPHPQLGLDKATKLKKQLRSAMFARLLLLLVLPAYARRVRAGHSGRAILLEIEDRPLPIHSS